MGAVTYHGKKKHPLIVITIHKCAKTVFMMGGGGWKGLIRANI